MRPSFCLLILFYAVNTFGQIPFPKGFRLIKGESLSGKDDIRTNGKYTFQVYREGPYEVDEHLGEALGRNFGFPFHRTKDSLFWGTGRSNGVYAYVVFGGELVALYSEYNDSEFSYYSKWLLSTLRKYRYSQKMLFPPRSEKEIKVAQAKGG